MLKWRYVCLSLPLAVVAWQLLSQCTYGDVPELNYGNGDLYAFPAGETVYVYAESGIPQEAIAGWAGQNNISFSFVGSEAQAKCCGHSWLVYEWVPSSQIDDAAGMVRTDLPHDDQYVSGEYRIKGVKIHIAADLGLTGRCLQAVTAHETGHTLGLGDRTTGPGNDTLMYAYVDLPNCESNPIAPTACDTSEVQAHNSGACWSHTDCDYYEGSGYYCNSGGKCEWIGWGWGCSYDPCWDDSDCAGYDYCNPYGCCEAPCVDPCQDPDNCLYCDGLYDDEPCQECLGSNSFCNVDQYCYWYTPILIDVEGDGYSLTSAEDGVVFDIAGNGRAAQIAWPEANSDDAFLALDRNGNGTIDDGAELFGSSTPQPGGSGRNGFEALAVYDLPENGGNGDGVIDSRDAIFADLLLWQDANHNGISEAGELSTLPELGITEIGLKYHESKWTDAYGNQFRYRGKIRRERRGYGSDHWAYDVILTAVPQ